MTLVVSNLYLGSFEEASNLNWLKKRGIKHIINAAEEVPNYFPWYFNYVNLEMEDNPSKPVDLKKFEHVSRFIHRELDKGNPILIHCRAGVNRSASMVIYFLMRKFGMAYKYAHGFLLALRPIVNPHPIYAHGVVRAARSLIR